MVSKAMWLDIYEGVSIFVLLCLMSSVSGDYCDDLEEELQTTSLIDEINDYRKKKDSSLDDLKPKKTRQEIKGKMH